MSCKILLPLYIYPDPGAWDPLYEAIITHPQLEFLVVVNPNSGPGQPPWWPNEDYVREIPRLNSYVNVTTLGYVKATYCQRSLNDAFGDIEKYSEWSSDARFPGLGVGGIFLDETVNQYNEEHQSFLDLVDQRVKSSSGIRGERLVVHNPGSAVAAQLAKPGPDITTIVETSYSIFRTAAQQDWTKTSPYQRDQTCYMVYGVPEAQIADFVVELGSQAEYLFLTSSTVRFYESFGSSWKLFVAAVASQSF